jgi:hypothetical protein
MGNAQGTIDINGTQRPVFLDARGVPIIFRRWYEATEPEFAPTRPPWNAFDPTGRLANWQPFPPATNRKMLAETALGTILNIQNKKVVVFAAGTNKAYENLAGDDIVGYRIKAIGAK